MTRPTHGTPENLRVKKHSGQFSSSLSTTFKPAQQKLKTAAPHQGTPPLNQGTPAQHVSCDYVDGGIYHQDDL